MKVVGILLSVCLLCGFAFGQTTQPVDRYGTSVTSVADQLQEVSFTILTGKGEGSGVIVKRGDYNFVLTAAHVVEGLRKTRSVIDPKTGTQRTLIEFDDARVLQKVYEGGRLVGQVEMVARIISYSDADNGEDLAVLRLLKKNFSQTSASFHLGESIPSIGSELYHVGSLQGQFGSNSLTTGIISQVGRVYEGKVYDQTSVTAFPGSSGGGVFLKQSGEYVGMLVRGAGETFNLVVPIRRIREWTDRVGLTFILDPSLPVPSIEELSRVPIEDTWKNSASKPSE